MATVEQLAALDVQFWRLPRVMETVGLSKSEIYRRMPLGQFPRSEKYQGTEISYWLSTEVRAWQLHQLTGEGVAQPRLDDLVGLIG